MRDLLALGALRAVVVFVLPVLVAACAAPRHEVAVRQPTTALPQSPPRAVEPNGAIFQVVGYRPLFEDRKPRYVGDIVTVQINEKLDASQKANSTAARNGELKATTPEIKVTGRLLNGRLPGLSTSASTSNSFDGKGETVSSNVFTGTITSTVIEVLSNGNLVIAGEKRIGIRQNSEVLRFSGTIDPAQIQPGNTISSVQVADARLDYRGGGYIEEAQIQGWLSRFFNSWMPF